MKAAALLVLAACGRVNFDARATDATSSDVSIDAPTMITHVQSFQRNGMVAPLTVKPNAAGDLILFQAACNAGGAATVVNVTAPGWTFMKVVSEVASPASIYAATFAAVTPDAQPVDFTVTWTPVCGTSNEVGDEFANANLETAIEGANMDMCDVSIGINSANEAMWAACMTNGVTNAVGPGATKGADDGVQDWTEYRLTTDPAGTVERMSFSVVGATVMSIASLSPR